MALITWTADLSVGIASIDEQHKKLVELINLLFDAMRTGKSRAVLDGVFSDLVDYTATHFTYEEELFRRHDYGEIDGHRALHRVLTDKVLAYKAEFDAGRISISIDLLKFLEDWLVEHIKKTDKRYGAFLSARGVV